MKKHAYLITAYDNPYVLDKLMRLIDSPYNDIFLHLDVKMGDVSEWLESIKKDLKSTITLVDRRDIKWGAYSYTSTIIDLLEKATRGVLVLPFVNWYKPAY